MNEPSRQLSTCLKRLCCALLVLSFPPAPSGTRLARVFPRIWGFTESRDLLCWVDHNSKTALFGSGVGWIAFLIILDLSGHFSSLYKKNKNACPFTPLHFERIKFISGYECNIKMKVLFFVVAYITIARTAGCVSNI